MPRIQKRRWKAVLLIVSAVFLLLFGAFFIYTQDYYRADQTALQALVSGDGVIVAESGGMAAFRPENKPIKAGFIFYPGGKVEYKAYAPLLRSLAADGVLCVLMKMPFNLAVFDIHAADKAIEAYPDVEGWFIGGHSLGGSMAAAWCTSNPAKCKGLVLLGSYTASDLSQSGLKILSIVGSEDKVLNREALEKSKVKMPADAQIMEIPGGVHAQYGNYGEQKGDGKAAISPREQQTLTERAIMQFLQQP